MNNQKIYDEEYYKVAIMIGRFQVSELHDGHKFIINQVIDKHKRVILFLGVAKTLGSKKNPLDYATRKAMIKELYPNIEIAPLPDHPDDNVWSNEIDKRIRELYAKGDVILYGGRDSFVPYYHGQFECLEFEEYGTNLSGTEERKQLSIEVKASKDFRHGIIYNSFNQHKKTFPVVNVICYSSLKKEIYLTRDEYTGKNKILGGFLHNDTSYENAAIRIIDNSLYSFKTLSENDITYFGSQIINDWRYKGEEDKIMSSIFLFNVDKYSIDTKALDITVIKIDEYIDSDIVSEHIDIITNFILKQK